MLPPLAFPAIPAQGWREDRRVSTTTLAARDCGRLRTASPGQPIEILLNTQGRPADVEWTRAEWTGICRHLHNENGDFRFVMGFRKHGLKQYVRSKRVTMNRAIDWGWTSILGKAKTPMAFVPYSTNNRKQSRWGAMDFDAHEGEHERARSFAFAAFQELIKHTGFFVILETSGAGWHVWAVSQDFQPVGRWVKLLKAIAQAIGAPIRDGVCEIFPPDTLPENSEFGLGMRAPGSWNPGTESANLIFFHNLQNLENAQDSACRLTDKEKKYLSIPPTGAPAGLYRAWIDKWKRNFSITSRSTRNGKLCGLVGEIFHQVGHEMARRIVEEQFRSKTVATVATLPQHMESFTELWTGLHRRWLADLDPAERTRFDSLHTENLRDAFRIVRSYWRLAGERGEADFGIAAADLGNRLGVSLQTACQIRKGLADSGAIEQTAPYQPNRQPAHYRDGNSICDTGQ